MPAIKLLRILMQVSNEINDYQLVVMVYEELIRTKSELNAIKK